MKHSVAFSIFLTISSFLSLTLALVLSDLFLSLSLYLSPSPCLFPSPCLLLSLSLPKGCYHCFMSESNNPNTYSGLFLRVYFCGFYRRKHMKIFCGFTDFKYPVILIKHRQRNYFRIRKRRVQLSYCFTLSGQWGARLIAVSHFLKSHNFANY